MIEKIIMSIFGDPDKKKITQYSTIVGEINRKYREFSAYTLDDVKNKTQELKNKFEGLNFQNEEDSIKINFLPEEIKMYHMSLPRVSQLVYVPRDIIPITGVIVWSTLRLNCVGRRLSRTTMSDRYIKTSLL